VADERGVMG
jgi:hypothetical protein